MKSFFKLITNQYFYLILIVLFALTVRLYKIDAPIADWHSWRQVDTASVTRNLVKMGFNPLFPKYDDSSGVSEQPYPNPSRFRFVEFPIYNIATLPFYLFFGISDHLSRLVSVLFSLGSVIFIFLIAKRYINVFAGLLAALLFATMPFNVYFSRTTLPEPTFIFFALGMLYFTDIWIEKSKRSVGVLACLFMAIAFLMKPWAIFFAIPLIYSAFKKKGIKFLVNPKYWFFGIISLLPFILWRLWILQYPEGIPASSWLLNSDGIRFRPAFWYWILQARIGGEILGVTGAILLVLGLLVKPINGNYFLHVWALSSFSFMIIFATGNVRHDYYQTQFLPIATIFMAIGFLSLISGIKGLIPRIWTIPIAVLFLLFTISLTWTQVKEFYKINNPAIIEAGKKADQILPKNAVVVAPYNGDTAFLYQTNRSGWAVTAFPIIEMVSNYGVTSYVSTTNDAKTAWVKKYFVVLEDNSQYTIADLTRLKKPLDPNDREP
jgi:4-amino-4-deoxy-L-arabinose transferase-like glycosyltransferase